MRPAIERHHVMLALRGELDIAHQHEVVIARRLAKGAGEHLCRTLMIALIQFVEGFDYAARRTKKTLAVRVLADLDEEGLLRRFGFGTRRTRLIGADRGGQEFGRIEFGGPGFRGLGVW